LIAFLLQQASQYQFVHLEKKEVKKKTTSMLNSLDTAQECDARDDEFCTGADFIEQKYVS
jgi:hypothetical protein